MRVRTPMKVKVYGGKKYQNAKMITHKNKYSVKSCLFFHFIAIWICFFTVSPQNDFRFFAQFDATQISNEFRITNALNGLI